MQGGRGTIAIGFTLSLVVGGCGPGKTGLQDMRLSNATEKGEDNSDAIDLGFAQRDDSELGEIAREYGMSLEKLRGMGARDKHLQIDMLDWREFDPGGCGNLTHSERERRACQFGKFHISVFV